MELNINEAPAGFYAALKSDIKEGNVCNHCDARNLCCLNQEHWCLTNRCMPYDVVAFKDGKTYNRADGQSVLFKII